MTDLQCSEETSRKLQVLRGYFAGLPCVAVSFSGGVDSTLLLAIAHEVLGHKVIAVTETSALYPQSESEGAVQFCLDRGIHQIVVEHNIEDMEWTKTNPRERCYLCKKALFADLRSRAESFVLENRLVSAPGELVYVEGSNESDLDDFRPGAKAVKELGVESPLQLAHMTKQEVREASRALGLPTWNKPSYACLASRFPYGAQITRERLHRVERAENLLREAGFLQCRVRVHDNADLARIEVESPRIPEAVDYLQKEGSSALRGIGFKHVSLDMDGYRTGSMN